MISTSSKDMRPKDGGKKSENWTVLDEFAAKAMAGIWNSDDGYPSFESIAKRAYDMAAAMLAEKQKREGSV